MGDRNHNGGHRPWRRGTDREGTQGIFGGLMDMSPVFLWAVTTGHTRTETYWAIYLWCVHFILGKLNPTHAYTRSILLLPELFLSLISSQKWTVERIFPSNDLIFFGLMLAIWCLEFTVTCGGHVTQYGAWDCEHSCCWGGLEPTLHSRPSGAQRNPKGGTSSGTVSIPCPDLGSYLQDFSQHMENETRSANPLGPGDSVWGGVGGLHSCKISALLIMLMLESKRYIFLSPSGWR